MDKIMSYLEESNVFRTYVNFEILSIEIVWVMVGMFLIYHIT